MSLRSHASLRVAVRAAAILVLLGAPMSAFAQSAAPATPASPSSVAAAPSNAPGPETEATLPETITREEGSIDPEALRRACRDVMSADVVGWTLTGLFAATGIGAIAYGAVYQNPPGVTETPVGIAYLRGIGPGLVLAAIGTPIGRGIFDSTDPLRMLCRSMERNGLRHRDNAVDTIATDRVMRIVGAPQGPLVPVLVGLSTGACLIASIIPFVINKEDLAGPIGGITAAAVAVWIMLPPTPRQWAARRYIAGGYASGARSAARAPTNWMIAPFALAPGLSVVGTF